MNKQQRKIILNDIKNRQPKIPWYKGWFDAEMAIGIIFVLAYCAFFILVLYKLSA